MNKTKLNIQNLYKLLTITNPHYIVKDVEIKTDSYTITIEGPEINQIKINRTKGKWGYTTRCGNQTYTIPIHYMDTLPRFALLIETLISKD